MQTLNPLALTPISATLVGKILSAGDYAVSEVGIIWSKNAEPSIQNGQQLKITNINQTIPFSYQFKVENLLPDTKYYYRTYALSRGHVYYGETISFSTAKAVGTIVKTNHHLEKDEQGNLIMPSLMSIVGLL
jgi:phosphodiesterase/alkaline phosphatase D-like protein